MFKKTLLALAVAGMLASTANAAVNVNYTITTEPVAGLVNGAAGADGMWHIYATITGDTSSTAGIAAVGGFNVVASGGVVIVDGPDGDGTLATSMLMPTGAPAGVSGGSGFTLFPSTGEYGVGISASQNTLQYKRNTASTSFNILEGVGITAGNNQNGASWAFPVEVASGYYLGTGTLLSIEVFDASQTTLLGPKSTWPAATTSGTNGVPAFNADTVTAGVPEPASLGVLALGGLALLARRRKAC